jgi:hypothetical protein
MTVVPPPSDAGIQGTECTVLNTQRFRRPLFRVPNEPQMVALWFLRAVFADQRPTLEEQLSANAASSIVRWQQSPAASVSDDAGPEQSGGRQQQTPLTACVHLDRLVRTK